MTTTPDHASLLSALNSEQLQAATHLTGPAVVFAGAGSGKTRVICTRIAWLILEQKVPPSSILAVTFTNKAAKEMKARIEKYIGPFLAKNIVVSTFHAFCAKFLRIYAVEAGFNSSFSIFDDNDQKSLLKDLLKQLNVPDKLLSVATVKSKIDRLKNKGITPEEYLKHLRDGTSVSKQEQSYSFQRFGEQYDPELVLKVYQSYQKSLKSQNAMDFNDLLNIMYQTLVSHETVLKSLQNRFQYFLIDEFQDTNPIQFKLLSLLSRHTNNLFIVGDDDQSIYSWRGADPSFILNFNTLYANAKVYKLQQNYRSSIKIIQAAAGIIRNNTTRAEKTIFTQKTDGEKIRIKSCEDPYTESRFIADEIYAAVQNNQSFSDFCILYRTNAQSRSIEDELRRRMLPYVIYGSVRFYERAEIKILLSYLSLIINPKDEAAFQKVVNTPRRGFGDTALQKLKEVARSRNETLLQTADKVVFGEVENNVARSFSGLKTFILNLKKWKTFLNTHNKPSQTLTEIISDIQYEEYLRTTYPEDFDERWLNIIELKNAIVEFEVMPQTEFDTEENTTASSLSGIEKLTLFLERALLVVEPTTFQVQQGQANAVTLMTVHSAKGLEFKNVFIAGLEEGVLPHQNSIDSAIAVEEERRLMYVAVTRAEEKLVLSYCKRNRYKDFLPAQESRFISEIPPECVEWVESFQKMTLGTRTSFLAATSVKQSFSVQESNDGTEGWRRGQRVAHKTFGEGVVRSIEKSAAGYKLKIQFDKNGEKTLIHTFVTPI